MSYALSDDAKKLMDEIYREFVREMGLAAPGVSEAEAIQGLKDLHARGHITVEVDPKLQLMRLVPTHK